VVFFEKREGLFERKSWAKLRAETVYRNHEGFDFFFSLGARSAPLPPSALPGFYPPILNLWLWGIFGGIPFLLTGSTLSLWLKEEGFPLSTLGFVALLHLPYGLKFLWAPVFDVVSIPFLTRIWGKRKGWILLCQGCVLLGIGWVSHGSVKVASPSFFGGCVWIAGWAASHDLLMQASQMDTLSRRYWGYGEAAAVFGYRLGFFLAGAGALYLSPFFPWQTVWRLLGCVGLVGFFITALMPPVANISGEVRGREDPKAPRLSLAASAFQPFQDFFRNPAWKYVLLFMLLYRLQDYLLGFFPQFFYLELGFSKTQLALGYKVFGIGAAALGGLIGAYWIRTKGYTFTLMMGLVLHMVSNLGFFVQLAYGSHLGVLYGTVALEAITQGISITAFFSYQLLCCRVSCAVTQLALLTAFTTFVHSCFGGLSGVLVEALGWSWFFVLTACASLPALALLYYQKIPYLFSEPRGELFFENLTEKPEKA
jgi:MFS transporter, PAT family, beta-lactamase induction signal transducer AmpG